jgi:hypothetical protein
MTVLVLGAVVSGRKWVLTLEFCPGRFFLTGSKSQTCNNHKSQQPPRERQLEAVLAKVCGKFLMNASHDFSGEKMRLITDPGVSLFRQLAATGCGEA